MKPLPGAVLHLLETLPDAQAHKIVLNTDGCGHWDVEVYSRYSLYDRSPDVRPPMPLREKAIRQVSGRSKRGT
jgi:hypothetical protein